MSSAALMNRTLSVNNTRLVKKNALSKATKMHQESAAVNRVSAKQDKVATMDE